MHKWLNNQRWLPYAIVALAALITIGMWYSSGRLLFYADSTWSIGNPLEHAHNFSFGWKPQYSGGIIDATGYAIVPLFVLIGIFQLVGLNAVASQALFFFGVLVVTGWSAIVLLEYLQTKYSLTRNTWALTVPALFYMSNLYIAINGWRMIIFLYIFYAALPLLIWLQLKFLDTGRIAYVIALSFVTAGFVSVALTNLSFLFIMIGILGGVSLLALVDMPLRRFALLMATGIVVWISTNLWYLLPQFFNVADSTAKSTGGGNLDGSFSILNVISSNASFLNVLTLNGYYSLSDKIGGRWFPWADLFIASPFKILTFIFPLALIVVLLNQNILRKAWRLVILAVAMVLVGSFLAKGSHEPFGGFFVFLFQTFPVPFLAFRAAYEKLGIIVALGYLLTLFLAFSIPLRVSSAKALWYRSVAALIIMVLGFPVWTGQIFNSNNGIRPAAQIAIPQDYYQVADFLKADAHALTLSLPLQHTAWISSKWGDGKEGYIGNDILRLLSGTSIISTDIGGATIDKFNYDVEADFTATDVQTANLARRNIKYVVVRKDSNYDWAHAYGKSPLSIHDLQNGIQKSGHFKQKMDTPNLAVYELIDPQPKEFISVTDNLYSFTGRNNFKAVNEFVTATLAKPNYYYTTDNVKMPTAHIEPLFANVTTANIDPISGRIHDQPVVATDSQPATLYKTASAPVIRAVSDATRITISAHDEGLLTLDGTTPFRQDQQKYETTSIERRPQRRYFVEANNSYTPISSDNPVEIANRQGATTAKVISARDENMIQNGDFSRGLWQPKVEDCAIESSRAELSMRLLDKDAKQATKALELVAKGHIACTRTGVTLQSGKQYLISFDYASPSHSKIGYAIYAGKGSEINSSWSTNTADDSWHRYSKIVTTPANVDASNFFLYAFSGTDIDKTNVARYANVSVYEVIESQAVKLIAADQVVKKAIGNTQVSNAEYVGTPNNFERRYLNDWPQKVVDCSASDERSDISLVVDKRGPGSLVKLTSRNHIACANTNVSVVDSGDYMLDFEYKPSSDTAAGYYIGFNDPAGTYLSDRLKGSEQSGGSTQASIKFKAPAGATSATIYLYAYEPQSGKVNVVEYSDMKLDRLPNITGKYVLLSDSPTITSMPKSVEHHTASPVKHSISVKSAEKPFYLAMNQNYFSKWRLEINNGKVQGINSWVPWAKPDAIADSDHFKLNDFANGWYIDVDKLCKQQNLCHANPDGTYDLELVAEFTPQRWFYVGLIISGLTLAGCLGYLGMTGWRHWRRRRGSGGTRPKSQGGASPRASKPARRIVRL